MKSCCRNVHVYLAVLCLFAASVETQGQTKTNSKQPEYSSATLKGQRKQEAVAYSAHYPGLKTSLACYRCCVGESPNTKQSCETANYTNWAKGKDCGCNGESSGK
jgi:hypothetical protein